MVVFYGAYIFFYTLSSNYRNTIESSKGKKKIPIGFDAEWPFNKTTKVAGKLALIQICFNESTCYMFHVSDY